MTINFLRNKKLTCWLFVREQWLSLWEGTCICSCICTCACVFELCLYIVHTCIFILCTCTLHAHTLTRTHIHTTLSIHVQGYVHIGSVPASPHGSPGYPSPQLEWACSSEERQRWFGSHGEASWDDGVGGVSQWSSCWIKNLTSSLPGHYDLE